MKWYHSGAGAVGRDGRAIAVNVASRDELLADIEDRFAVGRGFSVATLNLDHVVKLRRLPAFRDAYEHHSHVTADGNPIVWLSRLAGQRVSLVPGSELVDPVADMAASMDVPVAFFGSTDASLAEAERVLTKRYPGLRVVARIAPPMGFDPAGAQADEAIEALKAAGARLVLLALGAPKQEVFAARAQEQLPQAGFLSIGAGLDFISGMQTRAPKLVRRLAGEWLWRLALNPVRLARRYGACILILPDLIWAALRSRAQQGIQA